MFAQVVVQMVTQVIVQTEEYLLCCYSRCDLAAQQLLAMMVQSRLLQCEVLRVVGFCVVVILSAHLPLCTTVALVPTPMMLPGAHVFFATS